MLRRAQGVRQQRREAQLDIGPHGSLVVPGAERGCTRGAQDPVLGTGKREIEGMDLGALGTERCDDAARIESAAQECGRGPVPAPPAGDGRREPIIGLLEQLLLRAPGRRDVVPAPVLGTCHARPRDLHDLGGAQRAYALVGGAVA